MHVFLKYFLFNFTKSASVLAGVLLFVGETQAYIPNSQTIAGRVARNHGKGLYTIEQDVIFRSSSEPIILREKWVIINSDTMRLTVTSPKSSQERFRFEAVYRDGKRTATDLVGGLKTTKRSTEFLESFHHTRSASGFLESLILARILPTSFSRERPRVTALPNPPATLKYPPEPLVRLGRSNGVVTWIFGDPTPAEAKTAHSAAWVEQDAFDIRRIRFPSEAEMTASKHSLFSGTLRFPRERTVNWESNNVLIRVVSVKPLTDGPQTQALLAPTALTAVDGKNAKLPDLTAVKEFYSRFR